MATEPFFKASAMASHHLQRVPPWACCMPSQFAPSPKVQFGHWPPEEIIAGCSFLKVLSCHPNHSSSSYLDLILKYVGVFNHRQEITGPCGSDRRSFLSLKPLQAPEQSSDHAASVMLIRCTCTLPWTTSLLRLSVKRSDPPPRNLADSSFTSCNLLPGTFKGIRSPLGFTNCALSKAAPPSQGILGCVRSRENGCKADMLAWFASS